MISNFILVEILCQILMSIQIFFKIQNPSFSWLSVTTVLKFKLIALPAPTEADGPDTIGWGGTSTCQFSIKRAYNLLTQNQSSVEGDWKILWSWKGPHRIQTFMWLVAHNRILTNYRRSRWGVGISPTCPVVGMQMRLSFMCFVTAWHLFRYGLDLFLRIGKLIFFLLLIAEIGFSKTLVKNAMEFLSLHGKQLSWQPVGIYGLGETNQFLKKDSKDQLIHLMLSKITSGPLKKVLKIICKSTLNLRIPCILDGRCQLMVGWNSIVMEHVKVMGSLQVAVDFFVNLMGNELKDLVAKLEHVTRYMLRCGASI